VVPFRRFREANFASNVSALSLHRTMTLIESARNAHGNASGRATCLPRRYPPDRLPHIDGAALAESGLQLASLARRRLRGK
jgi:hypothetical protein